MNAPLHLLAETPIVLGDVPNYVPKRRGKKLHYSTAFRWATKGVRGRKLPSILVGGIRYTTLEALERFLGESPQNPEVFATETELQAVNQALDAAGL